VAQKPHARRKTQLFHRSLSLRTGGVTSQQVLEMTLDQLESWVKLQRPQEAQYSPKEIHAVFLYAAIHRTTIEQAACALKKAPSSNTVRNVGGQMDLKKLEEELNEALVSSLPKGLLHHPLETAIDLKLVPYYGKTKQGEENFLLYGPAREGTCRFFGYASIYCIKKNKRFSLALTVVRADEDLVYVLRRLLDRFWALSGKVSCLYLDREFYGVRVLRFLIEEKDISFCLAAPRKGKRGGIKGLIKHRGAQGSIPTPSPVLRTVR